MESFCCLFPVDQDLVPRKKVAFVQPILYLILVFLLKRNDADSFPKRIFSDQLVRYIFLFMVEWSAV